VIILYRSVDPVLRKS